MVNQQQTGFSLIELMIVVSLTVMLMLAASTIFLTFLVGNTRTNSSQLIKQEGQYALNQIEFLLRNSLELVPNGLGQECQNDMPEISFKSLDGGVTTLSRESDDSVDKIASNSSMYLTSDAVELVEGPIFDCTQAADGSRPYVQFRFTLRKRDLAADPTKEIIEQEFRAGTSIRSL